jgi:hypothetical protein
MKDTKTMAHGGKTTKNLTSKVLRALAVLVGPIFVNFVV